MQIFTDRYIGGAETYLQVLTAQTIVLQNERDDVDILRRRMDASVLLIKTLGIGWNVLQLLQIGLRARGDIAERRYHRAAAGQSIQIAGEFQEASVESLKESW